MSWAEIKKAVNSNLTKPLNEQMAAAGSEGFTRTVFEYPNPISITSVKDQSKKLLTKAIALVDGIYKYDFDVVVSELDNMTNYAVIHHLLSNQICIGGIYHDTAVREFFYCGTNTKPSLLANAVIGNTIGYVNSYDNRFNLQSLNSLIGVGDICYSYGVRGGNVLAASGHKTIYFYANKGEYIATALQMYKNNASTVASTVTISNQKITY